MRHFGTQATVQYSTVQYSTVATSQWAVRQLTGQSGLSTVESGRLRSTVQGWLADWTVLYTAVQYNYRTGHCTV